MFNKDTAEGKQKELAGEIKKKWSRLTDDDIGQIEGDMQKLTGKIQKTYGLTREEAQKQIKDFEKVYLQKGKKSKAA